MSSPCSCFWSILTSELLLSPKYVCIVVVTDTIVVDVVVDVFTVVTDVAVDSVNVNVVGVELSKIKFRHVKTFLIDNIPEISHIDLVAEVDQQRNVATSHSLRE